jgi:hypothetical protein
MDIDILWVMRTGIWRGLLVPSTKLLLTLSPCTCMSLTVLAGRLGSRYTPSTLVLWLLERKRKTVTIDSENSPPAKVVETENPAIRTIVANVQSCRPAMTIAEQSLLPGRLVSQQDETSEFRCVHL